MTKAEKAQGLVEKGAVSIWGKTEYGTRAYVKDGIWHLVVLYPQGHYFCECSVGHIHFDTTDLCVHAEALRLIVEK